MATTVKLAEYLFTRLRQLGVGSIHGVPGDYNLSLLDHIVPQGLKWVGNCNELNAGYAADGYARVKGLGALITTFGVGELSAINAIAGAYTELAPIIHIVGTPARQSQESRALIHHTLNDGEYGHFADMAKHVTVAQANLVDPRLCPQLIDDTIQQCLIHSRPVYIQLPADMVAVDVSAERLRFEIGLPQTIPSRIEGSTVGTILERMYACKRPMILVDGECRAYRTLEEVDQLVRTTNWPTWTTVFGKSLVNETLPNVHGIWRGPNWTTGGEREYVQSADLVLCFGPHFSSTNSYGYTAIPSRDFSVLFKSDSVDIGNSTLRDLPAKQFLGVLLAQLDPSKITSVDTSLIATEAVSRAGTVSFETSEDPITQSMFYSTFNQILKRGDIILAETGTAGHGCREFNLPPDTTLFKPSTWLSIGYMLPAAQGAALAQRELHEQGQWPTSDANEPPCTILLIGDGSFQMTVQELSTIIREKLNVLVVLINNDGYTIERCLHGYAQPYNDIARWRYLEAPKLFGATSAESDDFYASTHERVPGRSYTQPWKM